MRRGDDGKRADAALRALRAAVVDGPGHAPAAQRKAAEAHGAAAGGRARPESGAGEPLPEALASYIDKVARHAYKVIDEDIDGLRAAGYSEDVLFELTVSTALGAGLARLEQGLDAVRQARAAPRATAEPDAAHDDLPDS